MTGDFVIYWESSGGEGFVSYNNSVNKVREEYSPVAFTNASRYKTQTEAEKIMMWYNQRGGFGFFIVMKVIH